MWYDFEKFTALKKNVDLEKLIFQNNLNNLEAGELQYYLEIQPIIFIYQNYFEKLQTTSPILLQTKVVRHEVFLKLVGIFSKEMPWLARSEIDSLTAQFLLGFLLQTFNNKTSFAYEGGGNVKWFNIYVVFEECCAVLKKFLIYYSNLDVDYEDNSGYNDLIAIIINILVHEKIILKKTEEITCKAADASTNVKNSNTGVKKRSFYALNDLYRVVEGSFFVDLKVYLLEPFLIKNTNYIYMVGAHYLSVNNVFRKNLRSGRRFILDNFLVFEKIKKIKYQINWDMYDRIKTEINLEDGGGTDFFTATLLKYLQAKRLISLPFFEKQVGRYYNFLIYAYLENFRNLFKDGFYLSYFFDFRGRLYSDSPISPIGNKIFRVLYYYGDYTKAEVDVYINNYLSEGVDCLEKFFGHLDYSNIFRTPLAVSVAPLIFEEIGKLLKNSFIEDFGGRISKEIFIQKGAEFFENWYYTPSLLKNVRLEKRLEFLAVLAIFEDYNSAGVKKHIIYKDATASAIQLLVVLLGAKTSHEHRICNLLDDGFWYDTYYFIIDDFLKKTIINEVSRPFFKRKYLKKTIMTYNYSATFLTSWINFKDDLPYLSRKDYDMVIEDFKEFFKFLKKIFDNDDFFKNSPKSILAKSKKNLADFKILEVVAADRSQIYLEYKLLCANRLDKIHKKTRFTILFYEPSSDLDLRKTLQSVRPNLIHSIDAAYVRLILLQLPYGIITIHDSFGIDIFSIKRLLAAANNAINHIASVTSLDKNKNISYFSYYILL